MRNSASTDLSHDITPLSKKQVATVTEEEEAGFCF